MQMSIVKIFIAAIISFIAGFVLSLMLLPEKETIIKEPIVVREIKTDTLIKYVQKKHIVLREAKTKIIVLTDSLLNCENKPFTAILDTIVDQDTIQVDFKYPDNLISLLIKQKPDSIYYEKVYLTNTVQGSKEWWETPALISGGALVGFIIGILVGK